MVGVLPGLGPPVPAALSVTVTPTRRWAARPSRSTPPLAGSPSPRSGWTSTRACSPAPTASRCRLPQAARSSPRSGLQPARSPFVMAWGERRPGHTRPARHRVDRSGLRLVGSPGQAAARCFRCGGVAASRPSGSRVSRQPPSWTARWWARHSRARLARSVGPPWSQCRRWWASHQAGGRSQPATTQPPSRTTRAARWAGVTTRLVRLTSSGWVGAPPRVGGSRVAAARSQPARLASPGRGRPVVVAVAVVVGVGPVAGDQDPGDGGVAGQPPAGLGIKGGPAGLAAQPIGAEEAVQVHGDQQLGPDPTALGELAALRGCGGPVR